MTMLFCLGKLAGCTPVIVSGVPNGSVIRPFTGWRGNVALIVQPGSCKITDTFVLAIHGGMMHRVYMHVCFLRVFRCTVYWGDKSSEPTSTPLHGLLPCQLTYQYEKVDRSYTIHASYCYAPKTTSGDILPLVCANYVRRIDTSYDPANPLNITTQGGP